MKITASRVFIGVVAVAVVAGAAFGYQRYYGLTASELQKDVSSFIEKESIEEARQYLVSVEETVGRSKRPIVKAEYLYDRALVEFLGLRKAEKFPDPLKTVQYFQILRGHMAEAKSIIQENKLSGQEPAFLVARIEDALNEMAQFEREKLYVATREATMIRQAESMGNRGASGAMFNLTRPKHKK